MDKLSFRLDVYEGPLDLLMQLISKNKVNIIDIPIASITDQYFEALALMKGLDLEISSEFLVMASELLYIKSRMLLPKVKDDDEQEDPRADLVRRLLAYQRYKSVSQFLKEREFSSRFMYFKLPDNIEPQFIPYTGAYSLHDLMKAFEDILERSARCAPPPRKTFEGIVRREKVSVREKVHTVSEMIRRRGKVRFGELFDKCCGRPEMIATFLALLELVKLHRILVDYDKAENSFVLIHAKSGDNSDEAAVAWNY